MSGQRVTVYQPQFSAPVLESPRVPRQDVSSGFEAVGAALQQREAQDLQHERASTLLSAHTGTIKDFQDMMQGLEAVPFSERAAAFESGAEHIRATRVDGIGDENLKLEAMADFDGVYGLHRANTLHGVRSDQNSHNLASADSALDGLSRQRAAEKNPAAREILDQQASAVVSSLSAAGAVDELQSHKLLQGYLSKGDMVAAVQGIDDPRANPRETYQRLSDPNQFQSLDPLERERLKKGALEEVDRRDRKAKELAAAQNIGVATGVQVQINRFNNGQGNFTQADLDAQKARLKPDTYNQLQMQFDDAQARRTAADVDRVNIAGIIAAGGHVDPGDTKQVKAYDDYFRQSVLPTIQQSAAALPPDQQGDAVSAKVLSFVQSQGVVPESLKAEVRTSLRSGTPEQRLGAARTLDQLKALNPQMLNDFKAEDIRFGNLVSSYVDSGAAPQKAIDMATEATARSEPVAKALDHTYNQQTKNDTTDNWLASSSGFGSFWGSAAVPPAVSSQADTLIRDEFVRNGGNLEAARRTGLDMLKARFGPSTVNGSSEIVRNPPERHYGLPWLTPEQNATEIKREAIHDLGASYNVLTPDNVQVLPYPVRGIAGPSGKPAYAISVQSENGQWTVQMDLDPHSPTFGLPKPWVPSMAKPKADRAVQVRRSIDTAKAQRSDLVLQPGDLGL